MKWWKVVLSLGLEALRRKLLGGKKKGRVEKPLKKKKQPTSPKR